METNSSYEKYYYQYSTTPPPQWGGKYNSRPEWMDLVLEVKKIIPIQDIVNAIKIYKHLSLVNLLESSYSYTSALYCLGVSENNKDNLLFIDKWHYSHAIGLDINYILRTNVSQDFKSEKTTVTPKYEKVIVDMPEEIYPRSHALRKTKSIHDMHFCLSKETKILENDQLKKLIDFYKDNMRSISSENSQELTGAPKMRNAL